jgi:hypothetical protein
MLPDLCRIDLIAEFGLCSEDAAKREHLLCWIQRGALYLQDRLPLVHAAVRIAFLETGQQQKLGGCLPEWKSMRKAR